MLKNLAFIALSALAVVLLIIYFGISFSFLREDIGKTVVIEKKKNAFIITKDGKEIKFHVNEIIECYYVKSAQSFLNRTIFYYHKYLNLVLYNYDKIFITNLIANPEVIIGELGLKIDEIKTYLPYVDKRIGNAIYNKQEYGIKVKEFYLLYAPKSIDELKLICKKSRIYSKYAIIAAKQIIRETTNTKSL